VGIRLTALICAALLVLTSCGDGGGISLTPEQKAEQERNRIAELLVPLMAADEDWPFEVDDDATKQVARCWADEMTNILGLTSGELESLLERALDVDNLDDEDALQAIVDDLPGEQQMELGFSVLGCFEENARTTDFLQLMSNSDSTSMTTLTTIDPDDLFYEDEPNTADLKAEVKKLTAALEDLRDSLEDSDENTPVATTTTEYNDSSLYDETLFINGCIEPYMTPNRRMLSMETKVKWDEAGFTQSDYEEAVTSACECSFARYLNEIPWSAYQAYSEPDKELQIVQECQNAAIDARFESYAWVR
jgi:hypothetical protein